jgi:hypothetical protein
MATNRTTLPAKKTTKADRPPKKHSGGLNWSLAALAILLICLVAIWWPHGHKYPRATSREAYVIMDALHTACNTKNSASLDKIEASIAREKADGILSEEEEGAFARIIAAARAGRWSEADGEAVRFSKDQVGRGQLFDKPEGSGHPHAG